MTKKQASFCACLFACTSLIACDEPYYFADREPAATPEELIAQSKERIEADVRTLASVNRGVGSEGWQMAQDLCAERLASLGFEVERQNYGSGTNVIGVLPGTVEPEKHVLIGAHYDSVDDCLGADDNASGVAGTLEAARALIESGAHQRTLVAACWDEEERGLIGSIAYVDAAKAAGTEFVTSYSLEMIGYYSQEPESQGVPQGFDNFFPEQTGELAEMDNRGDFIALISDTPSRPFVEVFEATAADFDLRTVRLEFDAMLMANPILLLVLRSDHAAFWLQGYPAMMVTDTANFRNNNYHCPGSRVDSPDDLNYDFAAKVTHATVVSARAALQVQR